MRMHDHISIAADKCNKNRLAVYYAHVGDPYCYLL